jgi:Acetyltransferases
MRKGGKNMDGLTIRELAADELAPSLAVIRAAFATVAARFALTEQSAPTHPAFITAAALNKLKEKGAVFFGAFAAVGQIGFAALTHGPAGVYYLEKLAVLPPCRRQGVGAELIARAGAYAKSRGGAKLAIGIIADHAELEQWYQNRGFTATGTKKYPHLPFTVCFLEKSL